MAGKLTVFIQLHIVIVRKDQTAVRCEFPQTLPGSFCISERIIRCKNRLRMAQIARCKIPVVDTLKRNFLLTQIGRIFITAANQTGFGIDKHDLFVGRLIK